MILTFFIVMFILLMNFMWRYIDELVGKGLDITIILELMLYVSGTMIPMALPLATLLAAIMTMGSLGENYELLALKAAGISLPRILKPLVILVFFVAVGSFFVANNYVPYSQRKMQSILTDIRRQKQTLEFQDGIFFNGIDNMSIRVERQHPKTGLLEKVLIYQNKPNGNMTTTLADSGYIRLSDDRQFLLVELFDGETYEEVRSNEWVAKSSLTHHIFEVQDFMQPLEGFDMKRSADDSNTANNMKAKNIAQLTVDIDSLRITADKSITTINNQFLAGSMLIYAQNFIYDSLPATEREQIYVMDSIANLNEKELAKVTNNAFNIANSAKSRMNYDEALTKQTLNSLYKHQNEWHRKLSLPISIMIFFLIGAPLGAIIRRGGLGMPVVVSVLFFVVYYIISITGEKMAGEGSISSFRGMWLSSFILFPIAVFLVYKATNDSNLFNAERYFAFFKKIKRTFIRKQQTKNGQQ